MTEHPNRTPPHLDIETIQINYRDGQPEHTTVYYTIHQSLKVKTLELPSPMTYMLLIEAINQIEGVTSHDRRATDKPKP
jgi:hypothetical protein